MNQKSKQGYSHRCLAVWALACVVFVTFIGLRPTWIGRVETAPLKVLDSPKGHDGGRNFREHYDVLVVGAGPAGAVFADLAARVLNQTVLVLDERDHIGGRYFDSGLDKELFLAKSGLELFHTNEERTWRYWHRHGKLTARGDFRVTAHYADTFVPFPVNKDSIRLLNNTRNLTGSKTAFPEVLLRSYIKKRWGISQEELDPALLKRLQARSNWDDRYYPDDRYQGIPSDGYNKWFQAAFAHPKITVMTSTSYFGLPSSTSAGRIIYTRPMDTYFHQKQTIGAESVTERLRYRAVRASASFSPFKPAVAQPGAIVSYPEELDSPYTFCTDYSQFWPGLTNRAAKVYCQTYSDTTGDHDRVELVPSKTNKQLWEHYERLAAQETASHNVHFVGLFHEDVAGVVSHALKRFDSIFGPTQPPTPRVADIAKASSVFSVNIVVSVYRDNLAWMTGTCLSLKQAMPDIRVHFIVYSKHPQNTLDKANQLVQGCNATAEVIQLPNVGREGHTWLVYMLTRELDFADANVFLQGGHESKNDVVVTAVKAIQDILFKAGETQASSKANRETDIQDYEGKCPLPHTSVELVDVKTYGSNRLHFLALNVLASGWPYSRESFQKLLHAEYCEWVRTGVDPDCTFDQCSQSYKSFRGEHVVTDAGLRRALARHRTLLTKIYSGLRSSSTPLSGHALERLWLTLFNGVVTSATCKSSKMISLKLH
eukprot:m.268771 g.268771  ORF g.268771 m.268771 type:complete len:712 (-) comp17656_c0_seq4:362-2497(-)